MAGRRRLRCVEAGEFRVLARGEPPPVCCHNSSVSKVAKNAPAIELSQQSATDRIDATAPTFAVRTRGRGRCTPRRDLSGE